MEKKVSVVMPVYNGAKYLKEAINSILNQTFDDFEFIIINDGSEDESLNIIESYNDKRIKIINQKNAGITSSLNTGIRLAEANYIARMDADDVSLPNRLQYQYEYMQANLDCVILGSNAEIIDKNGEFVYRTNQPLSDFECKKKLPFNTPFLHPSIMINMNFAINEQRYPDFPVAQDLFLYNKLKSKGKFVNLEAPLLKYRYTPGASTRRNSKTKKILTEALVYYIKNGEILDNHKKLIRHSIDGTTKRDKQYQYYLLLGKKYLWNNYDAKKARKMIKNCLIIKKNDIMPYILVVLSLLPKQIIYSFYKLFKQ